MAPTGVNFSVCVCPSTLCIQATRSASEVLLGGLEILRAEGRALAYFSGLGFFSVSQNCGLLNN